MDTDWQPCDVLCACGERTVVYRVIEDSEGHADDQYRCDSCGREWWVDGPDY